MKNTLLIVSIAALMTVGIAEAKPGGSCPCADNASAQSAEKGKGPRGAERHEFMKKFDTDADGQLSETEREAAREVMFERMALKRFDADGDGVLSDTERAEAEAFRAEREQRLLSKFDADGDGELSLEERKAAREEMKGKFAGRGPRGPREPGAHQGPPRSNELPADEGMPAYGDEI